MKSTELHHPFRPEEIREGDKLSAECKLGSEWKPIRLWRYSPFGVEFVVTPEISNHFSQILSPVELRLKIGDDLIELVGVLVGLPHERNGKTLVGVRTFRPQKESGDVAERRKTRRWLCAANFLPTGRAPNPTRYNDFIFFKVVDISAGGLKLSTSLRNKALAVGQRLDGQVTFPLSGSVDATLSIRHITTIEEEGKHELLLGTQVMNADERLLSALGEYLLNFAEDSSVSSLRQEGFPLRQASQWFDFSFVKSQDEYLEVLQLRGQTEHRSQDTGSTANITADEEDSRSRILIAKHKSKVVGSIRLEFFDDSDPADSALPDRSLLIKIDRVCADPKFVDSEIFSQMMSHAVMTAIKSDRRYLLSETERSDFNRVGSVFILDTHSIALGRGISMKKWISNYADMSKYMIKNGQLHPTAIDHLRMNVARILSKFKK